MNTQNKKTSLLDLIKISTPTISMLVFMSLYSIVDGVFVSRFVGADALSAVNIIYPVINVLIAIGVMLATGGSAIIAKKIGEGKVIEAKEDFSLITLTGLIIGILFSIVCFLFFDDIIKLLGSNNEIYTYCRDYFKVLAVFAPAFILSLIYQILSVTAGSPVLGLILTLIGGVANIILDYIFIVPMNMGIQGASLATSIGNALPAIIGTFYFFSKKRNLYFIKPIFKFNTIINTCANGSSEMIGNLATGVTTMLFNIVMMKYLGADGVSALAIVLYGQFLITAVFVGFSAGIAPTLSYNYGANDTEEIRNVMKLSMLYIIISSIAMYILSVLGSEVIVSVFAPKGSSVYVIGYRGFMIFTISFIFTGMNIFSSAIFTAFSNGKVSATLSFFRTFVFIITGIILLPKVFGVDGVWMSVPIAELLSFIMSLVYIKKYSSVYGYSLSNVDKKKEAI